jgi:hypothetical protein
MHLLTNPDLLYLLLVLGVIALGLYARLRWRRATRHRRRDRALAAPHVARSAVVTPVAD